MCWYLFMYVVVKKIELCLLCVYNYRDVYDVYINQYYVKLWCRMGLYIIGIMFGYFFYKMKGKLRIYKVYKNIFFFKF